MKLIGVIDKRFHSGYDKPIAKNIGELKSLLQQLPDELPINQGFGTGVKLIVYNVSSKKPFLEFDEVEDEVEDE